MTRIAMKHAVGEPARHSATSRIDPVDPRNPGDVFLQQEIDANRRGERWLIPKALLSLAIVAALIVVRQVFFQ
jgi:hypothetical protein